MWIQNTQKIVQRKKCACDTHFSLGTDSGYRLARKHKRRKCLFCFDSDAVTDLKCFLFIFFNQTTQARLFAPWRHTQVLSLDTSHKLHKTQDKYLALTSSNKNEMHYGIQTLYCLITQGTSSTCCTCRLCRSATYTQALCRATLYRHKQATSKERQVLVAQGKSLALLTSAYQHHSSRY